MSTHDLIRAQWARDDEATLAEKRAEEICREFTGLYAINDADFGRAIRAAAKRNPKVAAAMDEFLELVAAHIVDTPEAA